jgi:hypothetical protein
VVYDIVPLHTKEEVEIGFVEVNHLEPVDAWVVWIFEEHHLVIFLVL